MNEKEIYALIDSSFDNKIKLNFDDVKKRIEMLNIKTAAITSIAPSKNNKRRMFTVIAATAACLVCMVALSAFFFQFSNVKSESASFDSYYAADEALYNGSEALFEPSEAESPECFNVYPENSSINTALDCFSDDAAETAKEAVSDSDISDSDITSESDA